MTFYFWIITNHSWLLSGNHKNVWILKIQFTGHWKGHTPFKHFVQYCTPQFNNLNVNRLSLKSRQSDCTDDVMYRQILELLRRQWIMTQLLGHYDSTHGDFTGTQGHFLNHSWKPYIQMKLIWMQYLKRKSSEPTASFINSVSLDQLQKGHLMTSWFKSRCSASGGTVFVDTEFAVQNNLNSIMQVLLWVEFLLKNVFCNIY